MNDPIVPAAMRFGVGPSQEYSHLQLLGLSFRHNYLPPLFMFLLLGSEPVAWF